jgi:hypothetical protein
MPAILGPEVWPEWLGELPADAARLKALLAPYPSEQMVSWPGSAFAWGDEGHEIIALVADHFVNPTVRAKVAMLLAGDTDTLTEHDIASEATWADKYRDSDRYATKIRYQATRLWHFVDVELAEPNLASACFGHPPLPSGILASEGPPRACVVDKIDQLAHELGNSATVAFERLLAL